ncbi:MAG: EAL domain-containing protein [Methylophilaceae bacterium]
MQFTHLNSFIRLCLLLVSLASATLAPVAYAAEPVKIGILAFRSKPQTLKQWQPLAEVLKQAMPTRDFVVEALTLTELEQAVASRQLDFVLTNPGHYLLMAQRSGLSAPLATLAVMENNQRTMAFGGVIFSRTQTKLHKLNDIRHKTIAATSTDSLGGYQAQAYELIQIGIHLPQDAKLLFTGMPHDNVVNAVLSGRADVGFVRTGVLEAMAREGRLDMQQIEVINHQQLPEFPVQASTRLYPEWPFAALPHVDENLARHVVAALFMLEENFNATRAIGIHGFVTPADYTPVINLLKELRVAPYEAAPAFTLRDVWERYRWQTTSGSLAALLILLLGIRLLLTKRKFKQEHDLVLQQTQQLQESEFRWKFAIEGAGDGVWDWNIQTNEAKYSKRWKEMLGYTENDILPTFQEWSQRIHSEDQPAVAAKLQDYLEGKVSIYCVEFRMRCKDESNRWILARGMLVSRSQDGKPLRMIGTHTDITERKQAEKYEQFRSHILGLLVSNESLTHLLQAIVLGAEQFNPAMLCSILLLDHEGRHLVNGAAPSLPDFYNAAINGINIGMGAGSCGTAAFTGERIFVDDIQTHPYWAPYKELAASARLEACWSQPILAASGQVLGTFAIYHQKPNSPSAADIRFIEQTAHLASIAIEKSIAAEKLQLIASVFTHAREGIMITAADGTIMDVNEAFSRITGYSHDEVIGCNPRLFNSGQHSKEFYSAIWRDLLSKGHWYGEIWNRRKNGLVFAAMQTISAVRNDENNIQQYVALFSDITALKEHESQLEHIAHYDALTNLPNRVLLADRLQQGMAQTQRNKQLLAVAYLDLDGFKAVNDTYGHEIGDQLLITISARMKQALREGDTLARLGGDEFVAVLLDLDDSTDSVAILNRLLSAAAEAVHIDDITLQVSASLGVTFFPQAEIVDADQLLRQADQSMYQAKLAGKNRYHVFDAERDSSVRGHHESLEHIRQALSRREFVLFYQPKVNMRSGEVIGAEALIRWQHPERGLLPPAAFLPVIEDHPLAVELGDWVITTALTQIALWRADGLDIPVSVNVGARQLQQLNFVERLREILALHPDIHPSSLEIEVLETSALEDIAQVSQVIEVCREIGINFALDDFGTGYSSLSYLKRLPVTLLKIDQIFVRGMLDDPNDLAILEGIIGLASAFRRQVIAEGVETIEHGVMLLQLGCELAQGYGIARPMPAHKLPEWAASWQPDPSWVNQPSIHRDDLPLLYASIELRAWVITINNFLNGKRGILPQLDYRASSLEQWLENEGQQRYRLQPALFNVKTLLIGLYALATELFTLHGEGRDEDVQEGMKELYQQRDNLLAQLTALSAS